MRFGGRGLRSALWGGTLNPTNLHDPKTPKPSNPRIYRAFEKHLGYDKRVQGAAPVSTLLGTKHPYRTFSFLRTRHRVLLNRYRAPVEPLKSLALAIVKAALAEVPVDSNSTQTPTPMPKLIGTLRGARGRGYW